MMLLLASLFASLVCSTSALPQHRHGHVLGADPCEKPGTCKPPASAPFSRIIPAPPRNQWWTSGGYCGSLSVQTNMLGHGTWISQDLVRKAAPNGGGHGNPTDGYEILHTNIEAALQNLKLSYDPWLFKEAPQPQYPAYLSWMKQHLINGHPIVWFVLCSGDSHDSYGLAEYDHIEPVFGIFSNHSLNANSDDDDFVATSTVYADDVLVHGSDWDQNGYYRRFDTLVDSPTNGPKLKGNCSIAVAEGGGPNEAYPCIMDDINYGYAIIGAVDPKSRSVPTSLAVDGNGSEPQKGVLDLHSVITVHAPLTAGATYSIFRFDGTANYPTDSNFEGGKFSSRYDFTASSSTQDVQWKDPTVIASNTAVYYVTVQTSA